jgi:hypothetical protein
VGTQRQRRDGEKVEGCSEEEEGIVEYHSFVTVEIFNCHVSHI